MGNESDTLQILIDVRSRLDDVVKAQGEFRKMREEITSTGHALKTGFGIELAHRGLELLVETLRESAVRAFEMASTVKDGARNLEISTRAYQVLGNAIRDAGGDEQLLTMAISNSNRSLVEARTLGSAAAGAYRTLGLDIAKLEAMPAERRFELIGRAVLNATDKTQAYLAASHILGSRNLPTLLGALKDVAENGWDKVAAAQEHAGRIMTEDTIERLEKAEKALEKMKQRLTIFSGEIIGGAMDLGQALKRVLGDLPAALVVSFIKPSLTGKMASQLWRDFIMQPVDKKPEGADGASAAGEIALKNALAQAEYNLAAATLHRQTVDANPNITDFGKKRMQIQLMEDELGLRQKLIAATKASPLEATETQQARDLRVQKLEEQNRQLRDQLFHTRYQTDSADRQIASRDKFAKFNEEDGPVNVGGSMRLGTMDWITGVGSAGEQVSGALQSSLGATVSGISDGIHGWLTGTQSFGSAMLQLGDTVFKTILDTIVQMGVQWVLAHTIMRGAMIATHGTHVALQTAREVGAAGEGATTAAAMAPAAALTSISSFGLAAILGIAALVAAMAAFGGFSEGGYTGDGGRGSIAGVVHGQEYVLNAAATGRLGTGFLDALNAGAPVSMASAPAAFGGNAAGSVAGGGSRDSARNIHIYLDRSAWLDAVQNDLTGIAHSVYDKRSRA